MSTEKPSDHSLLLCWSSFFFIYPFPCIYISLLHVPLGNSRLLGALTHLQTNAHSQGENIILAFYSKWWEIVFLMGILNLASIGMKIIKNHFSKSLITEHKSYYYILWSFFLGKKGKILCPCLDNFWTVLQCRGGEYNERPCHFIKTWWRIKIRVLISPSMSSRNVFLLFQSYCIFSM